MGSPIAPSPMKPTCMAVDATRGGPYGDARAGVRAAVRAPGCARCRRSGGSPRRARSGRDGGGADRGTRRSRSARHAPGAVPPPFGYPLAWCHTEGAGRVFSTALGHFPAAWESPTYLRHVHGGLRWALAARERRGD
ncbi:MAG: ThuA domain-containing protein [Acidimicrobiia bacterium]